MILYDNKKGIKRLKSEEQPHERAPESGRTHTITLLEFCIFK
jgi:hypothetical protein